MTTKPKRKSRKEIIEETQKTIEAGLALFAEGEADRIIGAPGDGYKELLNATTAVNQMEYALFTGRGLKNNPVTRETAAKTQFMMLQLIHNAYALGIKHGQERQTQPT